MDHSGFGQQDGSPVPLLYFENIDASQIIHICRIYSLSLVKMQSGFLAQSDESRSNFKFSYLELFFAGLAFYATYSDVAFFLFERNVLREELEIGILGSVANETSILSQTKKWKEKASRFSFSGFAQASLCQAGFITEMKSEVLDLEPKELETMMKFDFSSRVRKIA